MTIDCAYQPMEYEQFNRSIAYESTDFCNKALHESHAVSWLQQENALRKWDEHNNRMRLMHRVRKFNTDVHVF